MLTIPQAILDEMIAQAEAEYPLECCGLLAGPKPKKDGTVTRLFKMTNTDRSPVSYFMDPKEQIAAFKAMRTDGLDLLAIYHSHTHTEAAPSLTDIRLAYYPEAVYLIISLADQRQPIVRGYRISSDTGQVTPVEHRTGW